MSVRRLLFWPVMVCSLAACLTGGASSSRGSHPAPRHRPAAIAAPARRSDVVSPWSARVRPLPRAAHGADPVPWAAIVATFEMVRPYLVAVASRAPDRPHRPVPNTGPPATAPLRRSGASGGTCPYAALIRSIWTRDAEWAISVAWSRPGHPWGESHCVATAWDGGVGYGLFQITADRAHAEWYRRAGCSPSQWADPTCNTRAAFEGYKMAGRSPWLP